MKKNNIPWRMYARKKEFLNKKRKEKKTSIQKAQVK